MSSHEKGPNSVEGSWRGYGLTAILWAIEHPKTAVGALVAVPVSVTYGSWFPWSVTQSFFFIIAPLLAIPIAVMLWYVKSQFNSEGGPPNKRLMKEYFDLKDNQLAVGFPAKKLPMETFIEAWIHEKIDIKEDLYEILQHRYEVFKFNFTMGHVEGLINDVLKKAAKHDAAADKEDVADVYNKGNDFYQWFLDHHMLYSSGMFRHRDESLYDAQERKLHTICRMAHMKPGMTHLDLGCGWGTLIAHAAKHYGVQSTGVTLSKEQAAFGRNRIVEYGVKDKAEIKIINFWELPPEKKYDRITCLEMSEHIGIRDYQKFLHRVRGMLKDDGIFYLQIAGLRRTWQYEDLLWGLFMGRYIFPGADASCPLGWVSNQVERGGFEIHRVENTGVHYAITIHRWYDNWVKNKDAVCAKYNRDNTGKATPNGEYWWRLWAVFLAWSAIIAAQGTSTVFLITLMKNTKTDKTSQTCSPEWEANSKEPQPTLDRTAFKVDPEREPIGVQT